MINVIVILDYFCELFMDSIFFKVSCIDINYFWRNLRIDIKDEIKFNVD